MGNKMVQCSTCGADMAANAKSCPACGAKNKKPVYKKWWFWAIIVIAVIGIASANGSKKESAPATQAGQTTQEAQQIEYTAYDVTELFDALNANALKAQNTYKGQYVELSGYLSTIDSNGKYISLGASPKNYDYLLQSVHCTLKKDSGQLEQVMELASGDEIVVKGRISDVGEVLGYFLDVDSISAK